MNKKDRSCRQIRVKHLISFHNFVSRRSGQDEEHGKRAIQMDSRAITFGITIFFIVSPQPTSRLTDAAPETPHMQPRRYRGVRCSRLVRRQPRDHN